VSHDLGEASVGAGGAIVAQSEPEADLAGELSSFERMIAMLTAIPQPTAKPARKLSTVRRSPSSSGTPASKPIRSLARDTSR